MGLGKGLHLVVRIFQLWWQVKQLLIFGQKLLVKFLKVRQAVILSGNHWNAALETRMSLSPCLRGPVLSSAVPAPSDWPHISFSVPQVPHTWSLLFCRELIDFPKDWICAVRSLFSLVTTKIYSISNDLSLAPLTLSSAVSVSLRIILHHDEDALIFIQFVFNFTYLLGSFLSEHEPPSSSSITLFWEEERIVL